MHDVKVKFFAADYVSALQLTSLGFYIIDAEESNNDVSGDTEDVFRTWILNTSVRGTVSRLRLSSRLVAARRSPLVYIGTIGGFLKATSLKTLYLSVQISGGILAKKMSCSH